MGQKNSLQQVVNRVAEMSRDEIFTRVRQELAKRHDALRYLLGISYATERPRVSSGKPPQFFFTPDEVTPITSILRERMPHEVSEILDQAEKICHHRFDLLGYENLDYGEEIDWHLDAAHGVRAPRKLWYRIADVLDVVGDSRITWELSRHQHLVTLAKAYLLKKDERYVAELVRQWYQWRQENPYPIGINWASSLELAFRSLSWLWVRHLLHDHPQLRGRFQQDLLQALNLHGQHIERYLSTYSSPNTHLLGEGVGLFFIGMLCPGLNRAPRWRQMGWDIVLHEATRQVQPDGMHFEQSVYYHVYALDFFLHARILASANRISIPEALDRTIERMSEILLALGCGGPPPKFGDDDGGRVFNPRRNLTEHMVDPLAISASVYHRGDFKAAVARFTEEAVWLLGPKGVGRFDSLSASDTPIVSRCHKYSGLCVLAGAGPLNSRMIIHAGPQGFGKAGHGHAAALSVQFCIQGEKYLVDPGTYCYVGAAGERNAFRGTGAHNTLQVDGADQAASAGDFAWESLPQVTIENCTTGDTFDLFQGSHNGYRRLPDPVFHRRWVFNLKDGFWFVRDRAEGKGEHALNLSWHFAPEISLDNEVPASTSLKLRGKSGGVLLLPANGKGWKQEVIRDHISPIYGRLEDSPCVRFLVQSSLPTDFAIAFVPFGNTQTVLEGLIHLTEVDVKASRGSVHSYRLNTAGQTHWMFFNMGIQPWELHGLASDAQFLYCGVRRDGQQLWILCEGRFVKFAGKSVIQLDSKVARFEWRNLGSDKWVSCSDATALARVSTVLPEPGEFALSEMHPV